MIKGRRTVLLSFLKSNAQRTQISRDTNSRAAAAAAAAPEKQQQALQILRPFDAIEFTDSCGSRPPTLCNQ
ncbi:unnamed protein product [Acanthocheilonema viteae]|uniref:Uncharacterized protein n=1 Tax=Acanthocheilonema viteae TaxID=6277 RepID=A0A498SEK7_ACAVI|nr:unnamed protein product [Acanthocheilonema viteae]